jgi:aminoglycoside/choline kinase family phosphotransferase
MTAEIGPTALNSEWLRDLVVRSVPGLPVDAVVRRKPLNLVSTSSVLYTVTVRTCDGQDTARRFVLKLAREIGPRHRREVTFYRKVAPLVPELVPKCWNSGMGELSPGYLLLDDCSVGRSHYSLDVSPKPAIDAMVRCLAGLHAGLWGRRLDNDDPVVTPSARRERGAELLAGWRDKLSQPDLDLIRRVLHDHDELRDRFSSASVLCHGDFHPLNIFVGGAGPVALDWQDCYAGNPAEDLALLLTAYVHPLDRRRFEDWWLAIYREELERKGITGYRQEDLWGDYRIGVALALLNAVRLAGVSGLHPDGVLLRAKHTLMAAEEVMTHDFW